MKKFVFELQDVMKYREFRQNEAEVELGRALAVETGIQTKLDNLATEAAASRRAVKGSTDFAAINAAHSFDALVEQRKDELLRRLAEAKAVTEQRRAALRTALQQTEALHKLRDRQLEEYRAAESHEEDGMVDDITTAQQNKRR